MRATKIPNTRASSQIVPCHTVITTLPARRVRKPSPPACPTKKDIGNDAVVFMSPASTPVLTKRSASAPQIQNPIPKHQ